MKPPLDISITSDEFERLCGASWPNCSLLLKNAAAVHGDLEGTVLSYLQECRSVLSAGHSVNVSLFSRDRVAVTGDSASNRYISHLVKMLPQSNETSLRDWYYLNKKSQSTALACVFLNAVHRNPRFMSFVGHITERLISEKDDGLRPVNTDMFMGDYQATTFGAHKDQLHNCMFQLQGNRRMLLWPDEVIQTKVGPLTSSEVILDYEGIRDTAEIVELTAGDILYWPSNYWHVGECDGFSISLNIDIRDDHKEYDPTVSACLGEAISRSLRSERDALDPVMVSADVSKTHFEVETILKEARARLQEVLENESKFRTAIAMHIVRLKSCWGLEGLSSRKSETDSLTDNSKLIVNTGVVVTHALSNGLILGYCGRSLLLPNAGIVKDILSSLNPGDVVIPNELSDKWVTRIAADGSSLESEALDELIFELRSIGLLSSFLVHGY